MQADAVADDARRQHIAFQHLAHHEHAHHHRHQRPVAAGLHHRGDHAQHDAGGGTQIRHETDQAGDDAHQQAHLQAHDRQADGIDRAQRQHHQELAAQERAQHLVGLQRQPGDRGDMVARHQRGDAFDQQVPVAQEVEGQDRQQHQVGDPRHHREAGAREIAEQRGRHATGLLPVAAHPLGQAVHVQPGDQFQPGPLLHPRQRRLHEPVAVRRQRFDHRDHLPLDHRHQDHQRQHQQQQHQGEDQHDRGRARAPRPFQPVHPRVAQPAQQRRADEGREHGRQQPDQPARDQGDQQPLPAAGQRTCRRGGEIHAASLCQRIW